MTRYEELCASYADARARADARRARCAALLERLRGRLVAHLEMPADALAFRPVDSEPESAPSETLLGAMSVADDGAWHVGIQIELRDPAKPDTPFLVSFDLTVREDEGRFVVSVSEDDPGRVVQAEDTAALDEVAASLYRRLADWLRENLDQALGAAGRSERFGVYL